VAIDGRLIEGPRVFCAGRALTPFGGIFDAADPNADPLADIAILQQPDQLAAVIKDGRLIDRNAEGFRRLADEPPRAGITLQGVRILDLKRGQGRTFRKFARIHCASLKASAVQARPKITDGVCELAAATSAD
jgi:hypothetical protein